MPGGWQYEENCNYRSEFFSESAHLKAKRWDMRHMYLHGKMALSERGQQIILSYQHCGKEAILEECRRIQPDAVATIASDLANITVQYLAEQLGLPHNSDNCIYISTNKFAMREAFSKHGVPTPGFVSVCEGDDYAKAVESMQFPMIVKPTDRSGSRGIMRVESLEEIAPAVEEAVRNSFERRQLLKNISKAMNIAVNVFLIRADIMCWR